MNKLNYKECVPVNDKDNEWLKYYTEAYLNDTATRQDECKHAQLGYKYTNEDEWYYQYDRNEKRYYIVVDLED